MSAPLRQKAYQAFGDLHLSFAGIDSAAVSDYRRDLDLRTGVVTTRFQSGGAVHTREVFASHPDQVVVMRHRSPRKYRSTAAIVPSWVTAVNAAPGSSQPAKAGTMRR